MIVWNAHRTTAIVIRHDGRSVRLVPMKSGAPLGQPLQPEKFDAEWREYDYPSTRPSSFLDHAHQQGATVRGPET